MKWWEQDWTEEVALFGIIVVGVTTAMLLGEKSMVLLNTIVSGLLGYLAKGIKDKLK